MAKKILIHACCGPCLIYPGRMLATEFEIGVFFYNPNIHPSLEYARRLESLSGYCRTSNLPLSVGEYEPKHYFQAVAFKEENRCEQCYRLRLSETARKAAEDRLDSFTTTLTVSPYQDHEAIRKIGHEAAREHGVSFVYRDFREGFREGQNAAANAGLYRQAYCGCLFSEQERYSKKLRRLVGDAQVLEHAG